MKVSFGAVISKKEPNMYMTKKQYEVDKAVDNAFYSTEYQTGNPPGYGTLSEYIEEQTGSDVIVTHKKDGNVEVKLYRSASKAFDENYSEETDIENKPLKILLRLNKSLSSLKRQIAKFADRCYDYADYGFTALEDQKLQEAIDADQDEFMKKQAAIDAIREEERFDEEFGVGTEERFY